MHTNFFKKFLTLILTLSTFAPSSAPAQRRGGPVSLVILDAQAEGGTRVFVQARLTENDAPLTGAVVTAGLRSEDGKTNALRLFDDGQHDDGEAGDGVYGGRSADGVAPADYFVEVHAGPAAATGFVTFKR